MSSSNPTTGTRIDEVGDGIFRINTPIREIPGGFSFNQYLVIDEEPLLFHAGPRRLFPAVHSAIEQVMPMERLRWISFSHVEADECGALNSLLAVAPRAEPVVGQVAANVSVRDLSDRAPRALGDGESFCTGRRTFTWLDAPHLPHGWEAGYLFESRTRTLFCGDLFTQPGAVTPPVTEEDVLGPSEGFRGVMDYFAHGRQQAMLLEKLARTEPTLLACMHGSAWRGNGAGLIRALSDVLAKSG